MIAIILFAYVVVLCAAIVYVAAVVGAVAFFIFVAGVVLLKIVYCCLLSCKLVGA